MNALFVYCGQTHSTEFDPQHRAAYQLKRIKSVIYLEVAFSSESSATDGADKRFLPGVCALMDLQSAG